MNWLDKLRNKAELEYTLNESESLEAVLNQTNLNDENKDSMREIAKSIATAKILIEQNPYATDKDKQYLKNTEDKYNQLKNEWSNQES